MQKLFYIFILFISFPVIGQTQNISQVYIDRCTNETKVVTANFVNGSATVAFYNRVKTFTWAEYTNGTLKAWLDETYVWWNNLSPCSTNTSTSQTTQQTTSNATSNATNAASNATSNATNTTGNTSSTNSSSSSSSSNSSGTDSQSGNSNNESSNSSGEGSSSEGGEGSGGETSEGEGSSSENKETEESEEVKEESKEEKKEESEEESSEEKEEKEEKKEEKKKRNPIAVAANIMTQSGLDGTISRAASFGFSQSSLTGTTTYAVNAMVWDNLQQFSIGFSQSDVLFNYDKPVNYYLYNPETGKEDILFYTLKEKGTIYKIQSISFNFMYMYGTKTISFGVSDVFLGQKENFWKGFVGGYAITGVVINIDKNIMVMPSGVLFGTKPFNTKRVVISPMIALAFNPISYSFNKTEPVFKGELTLNEHVTYIIGSNFDVGITQRFRFNIGGNIVGTTLPGIPITWAATIGSKFQF